MIAKWKAWLDSHLKYWFAAPVCRECGLSYDEARAAIRSVDHLELEVVQERSAKTLALSTVAAQHELITTLENHLVFLKKIAEAPGPIKHEGKVISKYKVIAFECEVATQHIQQHLTQEH